MKLLAVAERTDSRITDDPEHLADSSRGFGPCPSRARAARSSARVRARVVQRRVRRGCELRRAHALRARGRRSADRVRRSRRPHRSGEPSELGRSRKGRAARRGAPAADRGTALRVVPEHGRDRPPGVLGAVATAFGSHGVSIRSMEQVGLGDEARLIFLTHVAREGDIRATLEDSAATRHGRARGWGPSGRGRRRGQVTPGPPGKGLAGCRRGVPGIPAGWPFDACGDPFGGRDPACWRRPGCLSRLARGSSSSSKGSIRQGRSRTGE